MNLRKKKRPANWPKKGLYFCLHHKVKCEYTHNIDERWDYSCKEKAYHELGVRLNAMRPVKGELPAELTVLGAQLYAAQVQLYAGRDKRNTAWVEFNAAWTKLDVAGAKSDVAGDKLDAAWAKLYVAGDKFDAAQDKLDAALIKYAPEIDALFAIECADVPWDDGLIFPELSSLRH